MTIYTRAKVCASAGALVAGLFLVASVVGWTSLARAVASAEDAPAAEGKVQLELLDWKQTQNLVASHKGKIVVLDAWSLSCDPCVREFPNLVKLHKQYGAKDVVCISMSCDYVGIKKMPPESYRERVLKFLTKHGATFQNVLSNVEADELFKQMDLSSIPAVYVYGRDGKLAKRFDNESIKTDADEFTYKDVTKLVEDLLAKNVK